VLIQTWIAILSVIVTVFCSLWGQYEADPSNRMVYLRVTVPCYVFLVYYWIWRKKHFVQKDNGPVAARKSLKEFWKVYSLLLRCVGWIFVLVGILMMFFAMIRILENSVPVDKTGDWDGLGMSLLAVIIGFVVVRIAKWNLFG